jgi:hypothetical protein
MVWGGDDEGVGARLVEDELISHSDDSGDDRKRGKEFHSACYLLTRRSRRQQGEASGSDVFPASNSIGG